MMPKLLAFNNAHYYWFNDEVYAYLVDNASCKALFAAPTITQRIQIASEVIESRTGIIIKHRFATNIETRPIHHDVMSRAQSVKPLSIADLVKKMQRSGK